MIRKPGRRSPAYVLADRDLREVQEADRQERHPQRDDRLHADAVYELGGDPDQTIAVPATAVVTPVLIGE